MAVLKSFQKSLNKSFPHTLVSGNPFGEPAALARPMLAALIRRGRCEKRACLRARPFLPWREFLTAEAELASFHFECARELLFSFEPGRQWSSSSPESFLRFLRLVSRGISLSRRPLAARRKRIELDSGRLEFPGNVSPVASRYYSYTSALPRISSPRRSSRTYVRSSNLSRSISRHI